MTNYLRAFIFFFLGTTFLYPQQTESQKNLLIKANKNFKLLNTYPEKAFREAKKIEIDARKINAKEAELQCFVTKCGYFQRKNNFKELKIASELLSQKAQSYQMPIYQAISNGYLFEAYFFSGLPDKALGELEKGMELANRFDQNDFLSLKTKASLLIYYANYYSSKNDKEKNLKYNKLSGQEFEKMSDGKYKEELLYVHYSNLASSYLDLNKADSAKYYVELSQSKRKDYGRNDILFNNLLTLGEVAMKQEDYKMALFYLKNAEKLDGYINHLNFESLYLEIIESYKKIQQNDSVKLYLAKRDSLKLNIAESQNKSLQNLLKEKTEIKHNKYLYVILAFFLLLTTFIFFIVRKNRVLSQQEKTSLQYLKEASKTPTGKDYSKLLKILKENDSTFMFHFDELFPDFSSTLLNINPKLSPSEIEFCAFLKMKIPTKDIARYKFIAPKTVLNKKYLIKSKLNIPKNVDVYEWFDKF